MSVSICFVRSILQNKSQIINDYRARVDNHNDTSNRSDQYLNVYDALWSIGFVLHNSRQEIKTQGKTLENLTYGDANATDVFRKWALDLDFKSPNIGVREMGEVKWACEVVVQVQALHAATRCIVNSSASCQLGTVNTLFIHSFVSVLKSHIE